MPPYRIMLVDDDEEVRKVLRLALQRNYEVVEAEDGLQALHRLERYQPDFAIIDVFMPLMDGFELCGAIRRHEDFRAIPVLFLSAYGSKDNIKKGYAAGANLFITKPVDPMRVVKNVDFTIEHERIANRRKSYSLSELKKLDEEESRRAKAAPPPPPPPPDEPLPGEEEEDFETEPLLDREVSASVKEQPRAKATPAALKPRVMIVENEEEIRALLNATLRMDFEITCARDGVEAIENLVQYQPDLILLDIMMPKMNGYQLLQSLRRNPAFRDLPVVIVSGKTSRRDREYAARLGATAFFGKPFNTDHLLDTVHRIFRSPKFPVKPKKHSIEDIRRREQQKDRKRREAHTEEGAIEDIKEVLREEARQRQTPE